ncbi:hypothetical protein Tco_1283867 [Tanacetum coccineum]
MSTLAEYMIVAGAENRPPMLDKTIEPLVYPTIEENAQVRDKKSPPDVYALVIQQLMAWSGMDIKMAKTCYHSHYPITPPAILTLSLVLPPSLLFDPRYLFVPEELLPPKKQIHPPSSSSTTLSNSSQNQTCDLVSPSFSVYTSTPPQIFEIGKSSIKIHLKHCEEQIKDILNYLEELSFLRIRKMEEDNKLKTKLEKVRSQIIKLQRKQLEQRDKIAFAHYGISNLEQSIEENQAHHQTYQEDL